MPNNPNATAAIIGYGTVPNTVCVHGVDWPMLRSQKAALVFALWHDQAHPGWGIISLLEYMQEQAVEAGVPRAEVYGEEPDDPSEDIDA